MGLLQGLFQVLAGGHQAEEAFYLQRKVAAMEQELARLHSPEPANGNGDGNGTDPAHRRAELRKSIVEHKAKIASLL